MRIIECKMAAGTEFIVIGNIDELIDVKNWLNQNYIRHLYNHHRQLKNTIMDYYYISYDDSEAIMAFKLRWS